MTATTTHACANCGKTGPVADDQTDAGYDELAVDSRGLVRSNEYVCGECLEAAEDAQTAVCGQSVEVDRSGVGHCWVAVTADTLPANVREEIEGEIIDGGREECGDFVASNGLHYRW